MVLDPQRSGAERKRLEPCMSPSSSKHSHRYAARIAAWSGRHRKKAIWGWLGFVFVVFALGNAAGTTAISDVDQFSGESHRAEKALDRAGMRPVEEVVFVQSDKLTVRDPQFRAAVEDVTGRLSKLQYVENVKSPLAAGGDVSADGHAALVNFEIAGDSTEARGRVDPSLAATAAVQASGDATGDPLAAPDAHGPARPRTPIDQGRARARLRRARRQD